MSEWQPIETAPKDGTEIVGAREWSPGKWERQLLRWNDGGWDDGGWGERPTPTLWLPLPPHE